MSIDRIARNQLIDFLQNYSCNDRCVGYTPKSTHDRGVIAIMHTFNQLLELQGLKLHHAGHLPPELKRSLNRWVLFLESELEYQWSQLSCPTLKPHSRRWFGRKAQQAIKKQHTEKQFNTELWPFVDQNSYQSCRTLPLYQFG